MQVLQDIIKQLRLETYGHDCWGRSESYGPTSTETAAADAIEGLLAEVAQATKALEKANEIISAQQDIIYKLKFPQVEKPFHHRIIEDVGD
jgi:hypothetical protein